MILIDNDDNLLRRVKFGNPSYVRDDMTLTSFAFKIRKGKESSLSVDLERLTTYEESISDIKTYRLYSIRAGKVREIGLECEHDPVEGNVAHCQIVGKFSNSNCSLLAKAAQLVRYP